MAKFTTLKDRTTGGTLYPRTLAEAVSCGDGKSVGSHIERLKRVNVFTSEPLTPGNFPEVDVYTREQLKMDLFIDLWNSECSFNGIVDYFGKYNPQTGFFELNGITDITYEEALRIWCRSRHAMMKWVSIHTTPTSQTQKAFGLAGWKESRDYALCRTYFPMILSGGYSSGNLRELFRNNDKLETITFVGGYGESLSNYAYMHDMFLGCKSLRKILCNIGYPYVNDGTFAECESLEYLDISMRARATEFGNLNLSWSPKLSDESISRMINKAQLQNAEDSMAITLHPDAYARLTDELVELAASKNITLVTA